MLLLLLLEHAFARASNVVIIIITTTATRTVLERRRPAQVAVDAEQRDRRAHGEEGEPPRPRELEEQLLKGVRGG